MNIHTLSDSEKLFGYSEIVLYYELKVKNRPQGFNLTKLKKKLNTLSVLPKIIIKQDYPVSSPIVESQTGPESLFLLSNWNHNFTFCDIIDQLIALQNIPPRQVFKVNKEEISLALKESNYADTQNPDSRLKIIKNTS